MGRVWRVGGFSAHSYSRWMNSQVRKSSSTFPLTLCFLWPRFLKLFTLNFELQKPIRTSFVPFIFSFSPRNSILMGFPNSFPFSLWAFPEDPLDPLSWVICSLYKAFSLFFILPVLGPSLHSISSWVIFFFVRALVGRWALWFLQGLRSQFHGLGFSLL